MATNIADQQDAARTAHDRLLGGQYAENYLAKSSALALEGIAREAGTLGVPQVARAISTLKAKEAARG